MEEGLKPKTVIIYQSRDVSGDFAPILSSVSFKDYLDGRAAEVELQLSNREGFFFADWYPAIDDQIDILIGYDGTNMLDAGTFWVDEVSLSGSSSGDSCSIRALSLRSSEVNTSIARRNHATRQVSDIVNEVADELGCTVGGDLTGTWSGLQNEPGLQFLARIAHDLGRIIKVEGSELIFYGIEKLGEIPQLEIKRSDVTSYDMKDVAAGRISKCTVKWWDSKSKKLITGSHSSGIKGGGEVVIWSEVENSSDAKKKAADFIADRNKKGVEFSINMVGDVRLRAGVAVTMVGFGRFDNTYYISEATHSVSSSGYTTAVTLQKPQEK